MLFTVKIRVHITYLHIYRNNKYPYLTNVAYNYASFDVHRATHCGIFQEISPSSTFSHSCHKIEICQVHQYLVNSIM